MTMLAQIAFLICVGITGPKCDLTYPSTAAGMREALTLPTAGATRVIFKSALHYHPEDPIVVCGEKDVWIGGVTFEATDQFPRRRPILIFYGDHCWQH